MTRLWWVILAVGVGYDEQEQEVASFLEGKEPGPGHIALRVGMGR